MATTDKKTGIAPVRARLYLTYLLIKAPCCSTQTKFLFIRCRAVDFDETKNCPQYVNDVQKCTWELSQILTPNHIGVKFKMVLYDGEKTVTFY